ncbi:site-specific DNA-methyltransferase [Geobacillus thermodenitrificans]|uniref:site-specific DNA-methyltransferase n=1 Tax=Geobacillus thermodenitrificans TaxID=33940 RepID=UPI000D3706D7|nr:site-specific DNA-methyltransferase [Geobacillus thermodenitrificans]PTR48505.1 site-specific DNA-methyltransferase [Geobacillus thermodenitrificans]
MEKLDGKSMDIVKANIEALKQLFPDVVTEGKIDFEKLKLILGEEIEARNEKYEFTWHGKTQAMKLAQTPSTGTLRPDKASSKNWDTTENLYIEGDNLEVLKLLQKSYFGKIKMIYIDPPYNTGKDFVYKDDFRDNIKNYKEITQQTTKANTETNGRYHTDWLNMMYPRLKLARNLLKEDGVIFISIDDNELVNLRKICDEIFGENNLIAQFTWVKKKKGSHLSKSIRNITEYVIAYKKGDVTIELFGESAYSDKWQPLVKRTNSHKVLVFPANSVETKLDDGTYEAGRYGEGSTSIEFLKSFVVKNGLVISEIEVNGPFVWTQNKLEEELKLGTRISLSSKFGFNVLKFDQDNKVKRPPTLLDNKLNIGTNEDAYEECLSLFRAEGVASYPKPVSLIKYLINTLGYYDKEMIVLDFFAGSATTAHAVMTLNAEDNGNRKFIMVQLDELLDQNDDQQRRTYEYLKSIDKPPVLSEVGKERIRRAGEKIVQETGKTDLDIGFKVFKLDSSNVKTWDPDFDNLEQTLFDLQDNIKEGRTKEDLLYEILLKIGLPLTTPIEEIDYNGKTIYNIAYGSVLVCLEDDIDLDIVQEMMKYQSEHMPPKVIFKESGFISDAVKTNALQTLKKHGITDVRSV